MDVRVSDETRRLIAGKVESGEFSSVRRSWQRRCGSLPTTPRSIGIEKVAEVGDDSADRFVEPSETYFVALRARVQPEAARRTW